MACPCLTPIILQSLPCSEFDVRLFIITTRIRFEKILLRLQDQVASRSLSLGTILNSKSLLNLLQIGQLFNNYTLTVYVK
ncbi:hypothetical protein GDO86_016600 [Hymenochirus boettgeri]|uniref:Uncharacterized protein n=1 Tax=Hymenochirus boettgeri TaxID=247094 RepID=A0A8T2K5Z1_9PIPI|nr:hypothetical protein GDO86_016600 [Hymenochirus boettgeri]